MIVIIIATITRTAGTIAANATNIAAKLRALRSTSPDGHPAGEVSARLHADAAVDADTFAIDVVVLDDGERQMRNFSRLTQPLRI